MQRLIGMGLLISAVAAGPAWGVINNGFNTDYVYALRSQSESGFGTLDAWTETGVHVGEMLPDSEDSRWESLTFSGKKDAAGADGLARMFVAKSGGQGNDIRIRELNAAGQTVKELMLGSLLPAGSLISPKLGNIRYNGMHNSLLVATTTEAFGGNSGGVIEVDLGLTTARLIGTVASYNNQVGCDFDEQSGEIYYTGRHAGGQFWNGKLYSMDYVTGAPTELHGGRGYSPWSVIYRDNIAADGKTLLIPRGDNWDQNDDLYEYYRSDLSQRNHWKIPSAAKGQLDEVNGVVWMGARFGGLWGLHTDDTLVGWDIGGLGMWMDADSPVPEPASFLLVGLGSWAILRRRRSSAS